MYEAPFFFFRYKKLKKKRLIKEKCNLFCVSKIYFFFLLKCFARKNVLKRKMVALNENAY